MTHQLCQKGINMKRNAARLENGTGSCNWSFFQTRSDDSSLLNRLVRSLFIIRYRMKWKFSASQFSSPLRSIPQAGYIKVGALRYGIRISNLNIADYSQSNKPQPLSASPQSSLIMSPSSEPISAKAICSDGCCCCIGSASSKTRLPMSQSGERNRHTITTHSQI